MTRRLHPAGIAVLAVRALREAAVPALVALVATVGGGGIDAGSLLMALGLAALVATLAAVAGYVNWNVISYTVSDRAITARRGLLSRKETVVPLEQVQALDTVQGPLQRLFGVTAVHVQAAGGGKEGEIVLEALSRAAVAELADRVGTVAPERRAAGTAAGVGPAPAAVLSLSRRRLAVAALTSGQLGVILPVLAAGSQVVDDVLVGDDGPGRGTRALVPDTVPEIALAVAVLLAAAWLLSILGAVIAFAGFRLTRQGERLLIRRGLLSRREASIPIGRVQAVTLVEGLLRQPFGLVAVRVEVAGYAAEASAAQVLFPVLHRREVEGLLAGALPAFTGPPGPLERPPPRALTRYLWPPLVVAGAAPAAALVALGLAPLAPLPLLLAGLYGLGAHRTEGVRVEPGRIVLRDRRIARRTVLVRRRAVQDHSLTQTLLQRRGRLAGLRVRAGAGTRVGIGHLDEGAARSAFERAG